MHLWSSYFGGRIKEWCGFDNIWGQQAFIEWVNCVTTCNLAQGKEPNKYLDLNKVTRKKTLHKRFDYKVIRIISWKSSFFVATAKVFWEQMYFTCATVKYLKDCETMDRSVDPCFTVIH